MEKKEFISFLKNYFQSQGFEKGKGNRYYRNSAENGFLCEIFFYKSLYGEFYYFDFAFYLGRFEKPYVINRESDETYTPFVHNRFVFDDKDCAAFCNYLDYTETHLKEMLDENMARVVFPPFSEGKKYLRENYGTLYVSLVAKERSLSLLFDD